MATGPQFVIGPIDRLSATLRRAIVILTSFSATNANIAVSVERISAWRRARLVQTQSSYCCCLSSTVAVLPNASRARPP